MKKLVSVIIPTYNHAHTLFRCVESLVLQNYRPLEIIIINDGSNDNFDVVIKNIKRSFFSINCGKIDLIILSQANAGAPTARNRGLTVVHGDYVLFYDADTVASPFMIEKMVEVLETNSNASYVYCDFKFGWKTMRGRVFSDEQLRQNNYIDVSSLIKRNDIPESGFDASLKRFQDWDLWLTLLEKNKIGVYVPELLYKKIVGFRKGISTWLPRISYRWPLKYFFAKEFMRSRQIVAQKHGLN